MGLSGKGVDLRDARKGLKKEVYDVVEALVVDDGWTLRVQGHKYALYCPCGADGGFISVPGTPRDPVHAAKRLRRRANHCPIRHELL